MPRSNRLPHRPSAQSRAPATLGLDCLRRYLQGLPVTERTDFERVWSTAAIWSNCPTHRHKEVEFIPGLCYFVKS